jgi:hypothetical protein
MGYLRHIAQTEAATSNKLAPSDLFADARGDAVADFPVLLERLADLARCW